MPICSHHRLAITASLAPEKLLKNPNRENQKTLCRTLEFQGQEFPDTPCRIYPEEKPNPRLIVYYHPLGKTANKDRKTKKFSVKRAGSAEAAVAAAVAWVKEKLDENGMLKEGMEA